MTDTSLPPILKTPSLYRVIAAYFLLMAIPEGLLAALYYVSLMFLFYLQVTAHPLDPRDPDYSPSSGIGILFCLFIAITAGFFFLPGYWRSWRSGFISKRFWMLSLVYNLFWMLCTFLLLVCSLFSPVNYFGDTSDIHDKILSLTPFLFALVGSALSGYCLYTYKPYAPSPN